MKTHLGLARHEGNENLFEATEMGIISCLWDVPLHIHTEGLRGTGKTTIMRAVRSVLPPIERIKGCLYNCDPQQPHCPDHKHLTSDEIHFIGSEIVPRPFLEISHSAKIGSVAGSIDLAKITNSANPTAAILPGIIPQAHRGIIFIDEINRLADTAPEITDVLLDVMGTKPGRVQIEETGLAVVEIPVQVSIWAASNPDEEPGPLQEIRRQLSDRFDLVVDMGRTKNEDAVAAILAYSEQSRRKKASRYQTEDELGRETMKLQKYYTDLAQRYEQLEMPDYLRNYIARTYIKHNLESLRAIEALQHAAILNCTIREGDQVLISDILKVAPLALQHRVDYQTLSKIIQGSDLQSGKANDYNSMSNYGQNSENNNSLLGPLKNLLSGKNNAQEAPKEINASPSSKAKRIPEVQGEDLITTEQKF